MKQVIVSTSSFNNVNPNRISLSTWKRIHIIRPYHVSKKLWTEAFNTQQLETRLRQKTTTTTSSEMECWMLSPLKSKKRVFPSFFTFQNMIWGTFPPFLLSFLWQQSYVIYYIISKETASEGKIGWSSLSSYTLSFTSFLIK